ncbi:MAG: glutaminyl-peptide cyclotransferase [Deltaproteobacteria bacterium]|jgi:glutamine cyclotransferase|nr:glutaminyl-peptide cyclotransferase [Deltaproteobacteria bacterium]
MVLTSKPGRKGKGVLRHFFSTLCLLFLTGILAGAANAAPAKIVAVELTKSYAKAPKFTQGLFFHEGVLYETSGLYGLSELNLWELTEGQLNNLHSVMLPERVFAEGSTVAEGMIQILTWQGNALLRYDLESLTPIMAPRPKRVPGEGWGLTYDGEVLWRSDGSNTLWAHSPVDFSLLSGKELIITDNGVPVDKLNELEYEPESGLIYANILGSDLVAAIDPQSSSIVFYLDFTQLAAGMREIYQLKFQESVLNGLAFDQKGALFATGKHWPIVYEVSFLRPL